MAAVVAVDIAYILGTFPSAYAAGRILRGIDIREFGDKNPGAANTFRELGSWACIAVGLFDNEKQVR